MAALQQAVASGDPALPAFVQALLDDAVKVGGGKAYVVRDDKTTDAATGQPATLPADAEDVVNNNRMRSELESALAALQLTHIEQCLLRGAKRGRQRCGLFSAHRCRDKAYVIGGDHQALCKSPACARWRAPEKSTELGILKQGAQERARSVRRSRVIGLFASVV